MHAFSCLMENTHSLFIFRPMNEPSPTLAEGPPSGFDKVEKF